MSQEPNITVWNVWKEYNWKKDCCSVIHDFKLVSEGQ